MVYRDNIFCSLFRRRLASKCAYPRNIRCPPHLVSYDGIKQHTDNRTADTNANIIRGSPLGGRVLNGAMTFQSSKSYIRAIFCVSIFIYFYLFSIYWHAICFQSFFPLKNFQILETIPLFPLFLFFVWNRISEIMGGKVSR